MQRIQHATAQADKFGAGKPGFSGGDPGASVPATVVTPEWLDWVQEELARAVEVFGPLDPANLHQLADALGVLVQSRTQARSVQLRARELIWETAVGGAGPDTSYWKFERWRYDFPLGFNQARMFLDLSPQLEPRWSLSKVTVRVATWARSGTGRFLAELYRQSTAVIVPTPFDPANMKRTALLASKYVDDGASGEQLIELTPSVSASSGAYLVLQACSGTPPAGDSLLAVGTEYTKTGV